ncbi:MAG: preprotein translocase subunit SecE [Limisphaerales bacterium]|jgi:preprotein translocase subunit SecE
MSIVKSEDGKKWINAFIAIISLIVGYVSIKFVGQMGEWFDLEAKVGTAVSFEMIAQGVGIVFGLACFLLIAKNKNASTHLDEVYSELVKVIWPDTDSVFKITIGLVIGLTIMSGIFLAVDVSFRKVLELIY